MEERLQKILSAAGLCSRRQAEEWLKAGRVTVDGVTASLGDKADGTCSVIAVDGKPISAAPEKVYLMLNKPRGYVTTLSDERGRPTAAALTADCGARVYPVGRLDMDSDGLLLMTNDGDFAQRMAHPSHRQEKEYHVTVAGNLPGCDKRLGALTALEDGTPIVPARVKGAPAQRRDLGPLRDHLPGSQPPDPADVRPDGPDGKTAPAGAGGLPGAGGSAPGKMAGSGRQKRWRRFWRRGELLPGKAYICLDKAGDFPYNTERKSVEGEKARWICHQRAGGRCKPAEGPA